MSQFLFYKADWYSNESKTSFCNILDNIILNTLLKPNIVIVVSDVSIKNNIATSIAYIHSFNSLLKKTIYHTVSITLMEIELFILRYGINQAVQVPGLPCIIVITDALYAAKRIFDSSIHQYQLQLIAISKDLWEFFEKQVENSIEF